MLQKALLKSLNSSSLILLGIMFGSSVSWAMDDQQQEDPYATLRINSRQDQQEALGPNKPANLSVKTIILEAAPFPLATCYAPDLTVIAKGLLDTHPNATSLTIQDSPSDGHLPHFTPAIQAALERNTSLTKLTLTGCYVMDRWVAPIFGALGANTTLRELEFTNIQEMPSILAATVNSGFERYTRLKQLDLSNDNGRTNISLRR